MSMFDDFGEWIPSITNETKDYSKGITFYHKKNKKSKLDKCLIAIAKYSNKYNNKIIKEKYEKL